MEGMWAFERNLIIDPRVAVLPLRCLFSGEPVESLTLVTLAQTRVSDYGVVQTMQKRAVQLSIPISLSYRRKLAEWSKKVGRFLVLLGIVVAVAGIAIPFLVGMESEPMGATIAIAMGISFFALVIGICFPYLDDMNGSNYISGVVFLKDGRILIPKVHGDILEGLPELERGFFDGLFGHESLKPKR